MQQKQEFECSICLQLMVEPVELLPCKHTFCLSCLEQMLDLNDVKLKCPLCRAVSENNGPLKINIQIQQQIQSHHPEQFQKNVDQLKHQREEKGKKVKLKISYGNKHQVVNQQGNNTHLWTLFVKLSFVRQDQAAQFIDPNSLIQQVIFELHPTFHPKTVIVKKSPFECQRLGWGVFEIPIKVQFKENITLEEQKFEHYLSFQGNGEEVGKIIYIEEELLKQIQEQQPPMQQQQQQQQQQQ